MKSRTNARQSYSLRIVRLVSWPMGGKVMMLWIGEKGYLNFMQNDTGVVNNHVAYSQTFITSLESCDILSTRHKHSSPHGMTLPARFVGSSHQKISDHRVPLLETEPTSRHF